MEPIISTSCGGFTQFQVDSRTVTSDAGQTTRPLLGSGQPPRPIFCFFNWGLGCLELAKVFLISQSRISNPTCTSQYPPQVCAFKQYISHQSYFKTILVFGELHHIHSMLRNSYYAYILCIISFRFLQIKASFSSLSTSH